MPLPGRQLHLSAHNDIVKKGVGFMLIVDGHGDPPAVFP
jgi:hypothetical protein